MMCQNASTRTTIGLFILSLLGKIQCDSNPGTVTRFDYFSSGPTNFGETSCPKQFGKFIVDFGAADATGNSVALSLCSQENGQGPIPTTVETDFNTSENGSFITVHMRAAGSYTGPDLSSSPHLKQSNSDIFAGVVVDAVITAPAPPPLSFVCPCPLTPVITTKHLVEAFNDTLLDELVRLRMNQKNFCIK